MNIGNFLQDKAHWLHIICKDNSSLDKDFKIILISSI